MPWSVSDYNTNPALNPSINGIDIAENSAAAGYNNALRQMMADIKAWTNTYAISVPVGIAQGGTGQTTSAAALVALGGLGVSFRDLPLVAKSSSFNFDNTERGGGIIYNGGSPGTGTLRPNSAHAINVGAVYVILNIGSPLTITRGAGVTLAKNGSASSADATIANSGVATIIQWGLDVYTITGVGVS